VGADPNCIARVWSLLPADSLARLTALMVAVFAVFLAASFAPAMGDENGSGDDSFPGVKDPEVLLPGRGMDGKLPDTDPIKLFLSCLTIGGKGGTMQGEKLYLIHELTSKKSTGYSLFVSLSRKHFPSSGKRTKLVRRVKVTCAVKTLELSRTSSPLRIGPSILTHV